MRAFIDNPPDAARVIESLRDTGYSFETAVADLVDNSIAANASRVDIFVTMDFGGNVHFSIVDDGCGMNEKDLIAAMKYGAPQKPNPNRLGKFGLGLKTASTAFCRRLEVTTRTAGKGPVLSACWDLDSIAAKNSWELELPDPDEEAIELLDITAPKSSGTAVVWAKVDRFFGRQYKNQGGGHAQRALDRKVDQLIEHLAVTFQRFLAGKAKSYDGLLAMTVNGNAVAPWDPFCSEEKAAEATAHELSIEITRGNKTEQAAALLRTVILPAQTEFSSKAAYEAARISLEYQGIYVYRHDRLLTHGNWLKMYAVHGSHNMLRVELSFDYRLDDVFSVPVDKSNIEIDPEFAEELKQRYLHAPVQEAERRRAGALRKKQAGKKLDIHVPSNQTIGAQAPQIKQPTFNVLDAKTGAVEVTNRVGKITINLPVKNVAGSDDLFVSTAPEIPDNMLFEPIVTNGQQGVRLNIAHDFYRKIYLPNQEAGGAILGIDSLLWALCVAELNNCTPATASTFREIRYEISKILRNLVDKLPDPVLEADE